MKYEYLEQGIALKLGNQYVEIRVVDEKIIRITRLDYSERKEHLSYMIEKGLEGSHDFTVREGGSGLEVNTPYMKIIVNEHKPYIVFIDGLGNLLLQDDTDYEDENTTSSAVFKVHEDVKYYGLGQHQKEVLKHNGSRVELKHDNTTIAIPFLVTNKGYGILWDNNGRIWADFTNAGTMAWESETGEVTDYYFIYGPAMKDVISGYWKLTGPAPMIPMAAFGFWQSKMRYMSQQELMEVGEKYREKQYPVDILVVDFYHWTQMGDFRFDPEAWPDPEAMFDRLKELHIKGMVSVWPYISENSANFDPMMEKKMLVTDNAGTTIKFTIFNGEKSGLYDPFSKEAREYMWDKAKEYYKQGAGIWWLDSCEPDDGLNIDDFREKGINTVDGPLDDRINAYALMHEKAFYEGQRAMDPDGRVLILARAAFGGCQRYGVTVWSGDVGYDFKALRSQITAGLNATISGLPFWTTDIGGFQGGNPEDPAYREVYIRWFQYGAFCPLFRVHGSRGATCFEDLLYGISRGENEVWSFGEELEKIMVKYVQLRYALMPYIYSCARQTIEKGTPLMRPLVIDFTKDLKASEVTDQFMFGPALMVCPVVQANAVSREVYLPGDCCWYDFWSGKRYDGGQTITTDAPLDKIPLYVKSGSIVPMGPVQQYTGEIKKPDILVKIYPGEDGSFQLYSDDGETFAYERGEYCLIQVEWDEGKKMIKEDVSSGDLGKYFGTISYQVIT